MSQNKTIRDTDVLSHLMNEEKSWSEDIRIFSWFANDQIPTFFLPLLRAYQRVCNRLLRDPRDIIFVTHILW